MCKLRWTPKGECSGLVETSAAIIKIDSPTRHQICQKRPVVARVFETPYFWYDLNKPYENVNFENHSHTPQLDIEF